jgi:hypothetical protein
MLFADQEDDPVLETALHERVHVLCTLDRHFHHRAVLESCRKRDIEVLTDAELLIRLRETSRPSSHND